MLVVTNIIFYFTVAIGTLNSLEHGASWITEYWENAKHKNNELHMIIPTFLQYAYNSTGGRLRTLCQNASKPKQDKITIRDLKYSEISSIVAIEDNDEVLAAISPVIKPLASMEQIDEYDGKNEKERQQVAELAVEVTNFSSYEFVFLTCCSLKMKEQKILLCTCRIFLSLMKRWD